VRGGRDRHEACLFRARSRHRGLLDHLVGGEHKTIRNSESTPPRSSDNHHRRAGARRPGDRCVGATTHLIRASGKSLGRSTTDSQGTVTKTDARGKVISREI
jgi:hypothetical protein